ncbi:hypothetical protein [Streptomyces sp. RKAG337]|uniref:hypothetical protein n=1 Tax=Streptomyces sp. RKAG337 TaxID=2893404 RepID=UPI002033E0C4|nr:hypothetical protein [Streptomyces sp. RKAG337]MCM2430905.1 hypothetical protein [Streptomyces sp. RKAG337]
MTTFHRGHPLTIARHEALSSPLPAEERDSPVDTRWLRSRGGLFAQAAQRPFELTFDLVWYAKRTGLPFHPHYVAQVYRGEPEQRLEVPLMVVNLARVRTREAADKVLAHESMHLRVPSYGHKREAFACAQEILNAVGSMAP